MWRDWCEFAWDVLFLAIGLVLFFVAFGGV